MRRRQKKVVTRSELYSRPLSLGREFFIFHSENKGDGKKLIKIEGLTKIFSSASDTAALNGISLTVEKGDIFGVIGMSGAGKSTLLRCIAMLETPTSGSITIDGADSSQLKGRELIELRKQIGVVFQGYNLLMQRNVARNIAFPLELSKTPKERIDSRVSELARLVGLEERLDYYPSQLSGGQMQRVAIARALAANPKIILCDEPTSALDSLTTRSILSLLKDINKKLGVTIMVITHEIAVVKSICNKVAVIDSGRLVEQGNTGNVLNSPQSPITKLLLGIGGDVF